MWYQIVSGVRPYLLLFAGFSLELHDLPCFKGVQLLCWFVVRQPL